MSLVHKLEQFVDHRLQKFPMGLQETGILSHNVHDVTGNNGFVVFTAFHFCETEEIFNDCNKKAFFSLLIHGARNRTNGPTQSIAVDPGPLRSIDLLSKLINHDIFRVNNIKVSKINKALPDGLIELNRITLFDELADNFSFIVFHNQNFFGTHHLLDHNRT